MSGDPPARELETPEQYDLVATLRPLADGGGDPTWHFGPARDGGAALVVRATWTPTGAATVEFHHVGTTLRVAAAGPGAQWVLDRSAWMAGLHDDLAGFRPDLHPAVARAHRRRPGVRMGRALVVWDLVVPVVVGQRVTTAEARSSWRHLVRRYGHAAPDDTRVRLAPAATTIARLGDADWHRAGVDRGRADAVRGLIPLLPALQRCIGEPAPVDPARTAGFRRTAESVRRVGPWTSTNLAAAVLGDPDVVLLGDLHVPRVVCGALAGDRRGDDARMLELLAPFAPHRGRVARLVKYAGGGPGPALSP